MSPVEHRAIAYRPEVDGLRAVAVLPVILFHAGFEVFSGGFVGVDIFFVISGYLITLILLKEMEQGNFSIVRFYVRRARRILPALFFVIACCLPFAWLWMLPGELKRFGQSMVAVATFSSNIYFWKKTDYFAPAAEEQPLLHTWSLAVEEQYYVLFPMFLMACWHWGKRRLFWAIALFALVSFCLVQWGPRVASMANFYLLPTRAWELLAGSLLAFVPAQRALRLRVGAIAQFGSLLGLGLILYSILVFDKTITFPSAYTLVPILGAVLIIACASPWNWVGRALSAKVLVGMGLISYSAYLWHQPLFAFYRLYDAAGPSLLSLGVCALASIVLAWFTWKYVEGPLRRVELGRFKVIAVSTVGLVLVAASGLMVHFESRPIFAQAHDANPDLFAPTRDEFNCVSSTDYSAERVMTESGYAVGCVVRPTSQTPQNRQVVGLWGDSHAMAISRTFIRKALAEGHEIHYFGNMGCPPIGGYWRLDVANRDKCPELNKEALNHFKQLEGAHLYLVSRWKHFFEQTPHRSSWLGTRESGVFYPEFSFVPVDQSKPANDAHRMQVLEAHLTAQLHQLDKLQVSLVLQPPEFGRSIARLALLRGIENVSVPVEEYKLSSQNTNRILHRIAKASQVDVVDVEDLYCDRAWCSAYRGKQALFYDDDHLSGLGGSALVNHILR